MFKNYKQHLTRLGLINETFHKPFSESFSGPEFDYNTGKIKANDYEINRFGEYFLKFIDLKDDDINNNK